MAGNDVQSDLQTEENTDMDKLEIVTNEVPLEGIEIQTGIYK